MDCYRGRSPEFRSAMAWAGLGAWGRGVVGLIMAGVAPTASAAGAQQLPTAAPSLVFDGVTVVDVEQGKLVPNQRVVIGGNRIQTVGSTSKIRLPTGAKVVDARGKYLIPGLWDMHIHPGKQADLLYPLFIANGVTGFRDAWSSVPLETMTQWRREILG